MSNWKHDTGIADLAEILRGQAASPADAVASFLRRIERLQPELNAFITVAAESATEDAQSAEQDIRRGEWKGHLHGIPVGIKDFFDTAGIRTTAAFARFKDRVPARDAAAVEKLKRAGAILVGKTNMHALGMGTTGLESFFGPVRKPLECRFHHRRLVQRLGGGGRERHVLRRPGHRRCRLLPTACRVLWRRRLQGDLCSHRPERHPRRRGTARRGGRAAHAGITARHVEDVALVLDALAERSADRPDLFFDALREERRPCIGVADNVRADREVLRAFGEFVETIRGLGCPMKTAAAPLTDFSKGTAAIDADRRAVAKRFGEIDLLLLPTTPTVTPTVKEADRNPLALSPENTMFANYYGLPAISVPCGLDSRGLPLGLQIVGKPGDDLSVLRLAYRYQAASGHPRKRPFD